MKRLLLLGALAVATPASAQQVTYSNPLGHCQLTSVASSTLISTCSGGVPASSNYALICVSSAAINWRDDGTAPTASVGNPVASGSCFGFTGNMAALRVIAQTGSPVVDIDFRQQNVQGIR